ncbi:MAG: AI-2E family transporter, partial [Bacteroidota bacterium]
AQVSKATLKGTVVVAIVQGSIGGVLFAVLGLPAALLWGVAMTLLALLPVGGSAIVWFPTAIILFAQGYPTKAIIIIIVGSLIIGLVDNLLRPLLVGRDTEMPDYLVLISTLGGITYFGLSGFVIGPTIAALFITVWEMMGRDYGGKSS